MLTRSHTTPLDRRHALAVDEPVRWLSLAWRDLRRAPGVALAYGLLVTVMGWLTFALFEHPYFVAAAVSGFLLVGPIFGAGLIETARALEAGEHTGFDESLHSLDRNRPALLRLAGALLAIAALWLLLSTLSLSAAMGPIAPGLEQALWDNALVFMNSSQLLAWLAIGAVLALLCYCVSVTSVPMILDRQVSAGEAMRASARAVARHPEACAAWALLIVLLSALGFVTGLLGFIVIYPLLGFASWHAYRALHG